MANNPGVFCWYELLTTDVTAAASFYRSVVGWGTKAAPTSTLPYALFTAGETPAAGLIELPEEGLRMGARPGWLGYVRVLDVKAKTDQIKRLGGFVYVPPTDTNIGRISVVADPHTAAFAVVDRLLVEPQQPADFGKPGRIGWNELFAADLDKAVAFYCEAFGWQRTGIIEEDYVALSAGDQIIGGAFKKSPEDPVPFWLFYFNVDDLDAAEERVRAEGGQASFSDRPLPSGLWVAYCIDPQGALFALQGKRAMTPKVGWSTEWQGFSSRGRLVVPKPRGKSEN